MNPNSFANRAESMDFFFPKVLTHNIQILIQMNNKIVSKITVICE